MKKVNEKGFTLAELLIVVAIIAVLVAIAIPTFSNQLERSREGVDLANLRNGYTEAKTVAFTSGSDTKFFVYSIPVKQIISGWTVDTSEFPENLEIPDLNTDFNLAKEANNTNGIAAETSTTATKYATIIYIVDTAEKKVTGVYILGDEASGSKVATTCANLVDADKGGLSANDEGVGVDGTVYKVATGGVVSKK